MDAKKSRADLWALAGIVAVEYSVNENNLACSTENLPWAGKGGGGAKVKTFFDFITLFHAQKKF